jgi:diguanylate cyclase (GGDEF)-like protein
MTILIAEDDPVSSMILSHALEEFAEEVLVAKNGQEAWRLVQEREDVRIIISDWMMPGIDGIELCRRVRALANRPYLYFIRLTARAFREDRLAGLAAGADDFLTKPLDRAELAARVHVARRLLATQEELQARSEQLERLHLELQRRNEQLAELATSDGLTGLKNHRFFRSALETAVSFANRQGQPLSLIMLDVDHFKSYNDTFGHPAGDVILSSLAKILREAVRDHDQVARYGGEEFALLLPSASADGSRVIGERLCAAISGFPWPLRSITASIGIATTHQALRTPSTLLDRADQALYHSKAQGRNRVTHALDLENPQRDLLKPVTLFLPAPGV